MITTAAVQYLLLLIMRITLGVRDTLIKATGGLLRSRGARLARVTKIRMSATYSIWIEPKGKASTSFTSTTFCQAVSAATHQNKLGA